MKFATLKFGEFLEYTVFIQTWKCGPIFSSFNPFSSLSSWAADDKNLIHCTSKGLVKETLALWFFFFHLLQRIINCSQLSIHVQYCDIMTQIHGTSQKTSQSVPFFMHYKTVTINFCKWLGLGDTLWCLSQRIMNLIMSLYWTTLANRSVSYNS